MTPHMKVAGPQQRTDHSTGSEPRMSSPTPQTKSSAATSAAPRPGRPDPHAVRDAYRELLLAHAHDPLVVGTPEWVALPNGHPRKTCALILAAAEQAAEIARDPVREYQDALADYLDAAAEVSDDLERLIDKRTAVVVSVAGGRWGGRLSYAELQARRAEIGPHARPVPPREVLDAWVATGRTPQEPAPAAAPTSAPRARTAAA